MALNTSAAAVLEILDENTVMTELSVAPFLTGANRVVTDRLSGQGIATATLAEIERWLTAHLIAMSDRETGIASEKAGDASVTYVGKPGEGLMATRYGQMAMSLDSSGLLAKAGKKVASMAVLDHIDGGS